jgi:pimeloyl-ACP methyl ester carboxylesterase
VRRIRGFKNFVFETIEEITNLVEKTHATSVKRTVGRVGIVEPLAEPAALVATMHTTSAAGVYSAIRAVNRGIQVATDACAEALLGDTWHDTDESFTPATPMRSDALGSLPWLVDHAEGALNGILGDRLGERGNPLDLKMGFRHRGRPFQVSKEGIENAFPDATGKIVVFVHGLCCTEWSWSLYAGRHYGDPTVTYGSLLQVDHGFTPFYVRYNTGRHVSENGRALADLVEELVRAYPVPVEEIVLVGHSMGGLVARSAAHYGSTSGRDWSRLLRHVFCLGSPHLGAPLEKATNLLTGLLRTLDAAGADVPADLLNMRSRGIKDLRFGYTVDDEWQTVDLDAVLVDNRHSLPLVDGVGYYFVAASVTTEPTDPIGMALGDLLVRLPSAIGHAPEPARRIPFRSGAVFGGLHHFDIVNHPDVYDVMCRCFEASPGLPELPGPPD